MSSTALLAPLMRLEPMHARACTTQILLIYLYKRVVVVEQGTAMVVERLGKFHRRCVLHAPFSVAGAVSTGTALSALLHVTTTYTYVATRRAVHCGCSCSRLPVCAVLTLLFLLGVFLVPRRSTRDPHRRARLDAGIHFLVPFIDSPRSVTWRYSEVFIRGRRQERVVHQSSVTRIDLRETVLDFPNQVGPVVPLCVVCVGLVRVFALSLPASSSLPLFLTSSPRL
jgi:hypothetical protein